MGSRQPHPCHYPPSPLQTPPGTAIHPIYYQQTPQAPTPYLPPRPLHNYTSPRSEYGSQYASSTNGHPQPRRSSFAQRYQPVGCAMDTPEHPHPLRRLGSPGYPPTYPTSNAGSMYGYDEPVDDNPIYPGQSTSGTLSPSAAYDADPHGNIDGLIQRAQGALESLTMPIHSLQHLCDRHRAVTDELGRFQHIADEQEKDMRELQEKKVELEAVKIDLEQNLEMSTEELDHLKRQLSNIETEVRRLSGIIEDKDEEKSRLEQRLTIEKEELAAEFKNWQRDTLEANEADRRSTITAHDAERRTMEAKFLLKQRSIEASHSSDKIHIAKTHLASCQELEVAHANEIQRLKDSHGDELGVAQKAHESIVSALEKSLGDNLLRLRTEFSTEKSGMQAVFNSEKKKLEEAFAHQKASLQASFTVEKNSMETEFSSQKREIEESFSSQKLAAELHFNAEIEGIRQICEAEKFETQKSLEAAKTEWRKENQNLTAKFNDEKTKLGRIVKTLEEENSAALKANLSLRGDKHTLLDQKAALGDAVVTLEADKALLISEAERQKSEWEAYQRKLDAEVKDLEGIRDNLKKEVRGLRELVKRTAEEEEGEERKSRGDGYYIDAFTKLSKDIIDISKEFSNLPVPPSGRVLAELPSGLPCMLANTDASRLIRMAYVQHIISKYLCHRIFQPFLFYLGRRYDKADSFLQAMSNQLREKSTRKEAIWRYYTLLAGYTGSNAKRTANLAATNVIEEIAGHVKPFADQKRMDVITSGISRIVKFAVETWRHARVEREIFTASMSLDGTNENLWLGHVYEHEKPYADNLDTVAQLKSLRCRHEIILPLLPIFSREGTLPSLYRPGASLDTGVVFSKGVALYMDCLPALQRSIETSPLGSVPALPVDAQLVTAQEKKRLSLASEREDECKAVATEKEVKVRPLNEQEDTSAKEDAKRQVEEEVEDMVRREEKRVARDEAERLAVENAEREIRKVADRVAAEEIESFTAELVGKQAIGKISRAGRAADLIALEEGLARVALECDDEYLERQELENPDCKHQADAKITAPNEKTPTEASLAENETWGEDEEIEVGIAIQQALINTQTAEDESLGAINLSSIDRLAASPRRDTASSDQGIVAPSATGETEQTDDTVETALEQQPEDVAAPSNTTNSVSPPQTVSVPKDHKLATEVVFTKLTRAANTAGAKEKSAEPGEIVIAADEIQTTAQEGSTEDPQNAVESEVVTLPAEVLAPVPLVFQPEGQCLLDTVPTETPQGASTDVSAPKPPITQRHEVDNREENPTEIVNEGPKERSNETLVENPKIPPNTPTEAGTKEPISSLEALDTAPISVPEMSGDANTSTLTTTGLVINDALSGAAPEIPNPEAAPTEHPAPPEVSEAKAGASPVRGPIAQGLLAIVVDTVEPLAGESMIQSPMIEEFAAEGSKVKGLFFDEPEAEKEIGVDPKLTTPVPQIVESSGKVSGSELKDSEAEQLITRLAKLKVEDLTPEEPTPEEPTIDESNAQEPANKKPAAGGEEPNGAVQESEAIMDTKSEAIALNSKFDEPKTVEPSPEAEERNLQADNAILNSADLEPGADETKPKPTSAIVGMSRMGLNKPSLSDGKSRGASPGKMLMNSLRHSASISEKRDFSSTTIGEATVEGMLAENSRPNTPESTPSTPSSPSPGPQGSVVPTESTSHRAPGKSKRKRGKKAKSQLPRPGNSKH
ncbi:unnamed protein product [Tuber aestivum]|uniref:Uncharacterized protein n=1 Tax=Tuber aestivum TaxID=59557 RepID=A0A292PJ79_9PEZI|nr:unnamed protein product [Tuber aestivum]